MPVVSTRTILHLNTFLWGTWRASSGYRPLGSRLSPSPTGVSQLPHQPIRCMGETNPLTQEDCLHYPCVIVVKRFISSSYYQNAFLGIAIPLLPLSSKMLIPEVVSRTPHGKEAEGNGETPMGCAGQLRPHRTKVRGGSAPAPWNANLFPQPLNSH